MWIIYILIKISAYKLKLIKIYLENENQIINEQYINV